MLSFLKGTALDYFELSLMDLHTNPAWSDGYDKLISELQTNFGPFDIEADAENELEWLKMRDNQKVAKYIISFQQLSSKVNWGDAALHHQFYNGLPSHIKDEIARVGKPDNLNRLCTLVQSIDARYWGCHSEISHENATSSSKADKSDKSTEEFDLGIDPKSLHTMVLMHMVYTAVVQHRAQCRIPETRGDKCS